MRSMREIKFRYWNTTSNVMVEDPVIPTKREYEWTLEQYFSERGWVWMQFTGLKDAKGVEIYEGDVVQYETDYYGKHRISKVTVRWEDDIENDSFGCPFTTGYVIPGGQWEVIGNIYQHPELLKQHGKN